LVKSTLEKPARGKSVRGDFYCSWAQRMNSFTAEKIQQKYTNLSQDLCQATSSKTEPKQLKICAWNFGEIQPSIFVLATIQIVWKCAQSLPRFLCQGLLYVCLENRAKLSLSFYSLPQLYHQQTSYCTIQIFILYGLQLVLKFILEVCALSCLEMHAFLATITLSFLNSKTLLESLRIWVTLHIPSSSPQKVHPTSPLVILLLLINK